MFLVSTHPDYFVFSVYAIHPFIHHIFLSTSYAPSKQTGMGNTSIKRCVHSSVCPPKTHPSSFSALLCAHKGMISVNSINRLPHPLTFCESQPVGGPHRRWQSRWGKRSGYFFPRDFPFVVHYCGSGCTSPLLQLLLSGPSSIALVSKKDLVIPFSSLVSSDLIIPFSSLVYFLVLLVPGYLNLPG